MWRHAERLGFAPDVVPVSLGEGGTPLLRSRAHTDRRVLWKVEALNPTGSQKDRSLSLTLTRARAAGARRIVISSTGSAGLACSAYSAAAGLPCLVLAPEGTPLERLAPMQACGATVVTVRGGLTGTERVLARLTADGGWFDATTRSASNPLHSHAGRTIAYEIVEQLGLAPDVVVVPVGGGGTLIGLWRGFDDLRAAGRITELPRLVAVQAAAFDQLVRAMRDGVRGSAVDDLTADEEVPTIMRNLKHGIVPDGAEAVEALHATAGAAVAVTDDEALGHQRRLAAEAGILCEPSSAGAAAAVERLIAEAAVREDATIVGLITGSALREPATLAGHAPPLVEGDVAPDELRALVEGRS